MSGTAGIHALDGRLLDELFEVMREATGGRRRGLARLARREGLDAARAIEELGAFPAGQCAARDDEAIVRPEACTAGAGCSVAAECPLVRGGGPETVARSATAELLVAFVRHWSRELPDAPVRELAGLVEPLEQLLAASPRLGEKAPPRARTSLVMLDLALRRGGPFGAWRAYLSQAEFERLAAHLPPGSARQHSELRPVEAWIRRLTLLECALVEL